MRKFINNIGNIHVGMEVKCISKRIPGELHGDGWKKDRVFTVHKISKHDGDKGINQYILWDEDGMFGVYSDFAKPFNIVPENLFEL